MGPELIKSCPHCQGMIPKKTLISWNSAGATTWTDGRIQGPYVPDIHPLARCPHCSGLAWLDDLPTLFERTEAPQGCFSAVLRWLLRQPRKPCLVVAAPNAEDCWQELAQPGLSKERLLYLRRLIWWLGNDLRRQDPSGPPPCQPDRDNMLAYLELLDNGDLSQQFTRAELQRQLGQFAEALQTLEQCPSEHWVTQALKELIKQQDSVVRRLCGGKQP